MIGWNGTFTGRKKHGVARDRVLPAKKSPGLHGTDVDIPFYGTVLHGMGFAGREEHGNLRDGIRM